MKLKMILKIFVILCLISVSIPIFVNIYVILNTKSNIITVSEAADLKDVDCILVLGAGLKDGKPSNMLQERLDTAVAVYNVNNTKVLMSGDHSSEYYDEVNVMKKYAISEHVPSKDIFMDHAGFSTYDSIKRIKEIFKVKKVVIVTQKYHLYRALYIAKSLGIEAYGVNATKKTYSGQVKREIREVLARIKDFLMVIVKPDPVFLGNEISLAGDGNDTNDNYVLISSLKDSHEYFTGSLLMVNQVKNLVEKGKFTKVNCDGKSSYTMRINDSEVYGIEVFNDKIHITKGNKELVLTGEDAQIIENLIK